MSEKFEDFIFITKNVYSVTKKFILYKRLTCVLCTVQVYRTGYHSSSSPAAWLDAILLALCLSLLSLSYSIILSL